MGTPEESDRPLIKASSTFDLKSDVVDDTFTIFTAACGVTSSTPPEVTLYLTDGNEQFGLAESIVEINARPIVGLLPPTVIVAVGYSDPATAFVSRARDLTPTVDPLRAARLPQMGGANAFAETFESEIMPWVEERYDGPMRRAYAGHSLGGLFGAHVALTRPTLFDDYILSSPGVFWDDECVLRTEPDATDSAARPRVFVGVGSEETLAGSRRVDQRVERRAAAREAFGAAPIDSVSGAVRLADRLDQLGMTVRTQVFGQEHHTTVYPLALSTGLRWLYSDLADS